MEHEKAPDTTADEAKNETSRTGNGSEQAQENGGESKEGDAVKEAQAAEPPAKKLRLQFGFGLVSEVRPSPNARCSPGFCIWAQCRAHVTMLNQSVPWTTRDQASNLRREMRRRRRLTLWQMHTRMTARSRQPLLRRGSKQKRNQAPLRLVRRAQSCSHASRHAPRPELARLDPGASLASPRSGLRRLPRA